MTAKLMLVTGATGNTGAYAVPLLLERGHKVRAFVHRLDARSDKLAKAGAEVVEGDLLDLEAVARATQGVTGAYFCYPIAPGLVEASAYFAKAARDAGVAAIVNMSQISARRDSGSKAARQHWISERVFDWSGVPVTHLRPTFFAEWLLAMRQAITGDGMLPLPFGDGRHAAIAAEDQAHVISAILNDPAAHAGHTYKLFGPVEMTQAETADELTRVLGRPVRYQPVDLDTFSVFLASRGQSPHLIQHLKHVALDYQAGLFSGRNHVVERIGGVAGMPVAQFVGKHEAAFAA